MSTDISINIFLFIHSILRQTLTSLKGQLNKMYLILKSVNLSNKVTLRLTSKRFQHCNNYIVSRPLIIQKVKDKNSNWVLYVFNNRAIGLHHISQNHSVMVLTSPNYRALRFLNQFTSIV